MKQLLGLFLLVLVLFSCAQNDTRTLAIEHEISSPINRLLTSFLEENYRYPTTMEELCDFTMQNGTIDADTYVTSGQIDDIINYLSNSQSSYVSFGDSCFFFSRIDTTGCCEYGNPTEIINHPWDLRRNEFHPMLIMEDGGYLGDKGKIEAIIAKSLLGKKLVSVRLSYTPARGKWQNDFYDDTNHPQVNLRVIYKASRDGNVQLYSSSQDLKKVLSAEEDVQDIIF